MDFLQGMGGRGDYLLLEIGEGVLKKFAHEVAEEVLVRGPSRSLVRAIDGLADLARLDEVEHPGQEHRLRFEA